MVDHNTTRATEERLYVRFDRLFPVLFLLLTQVILIKGLNISIFRLIFIELYSLYF